MNDEKRKIGKPPFYDHAMLTTSFRFPRYIFDFLKKKGGSVWLRKVLDDIIKKEV